MENRHASDPSAVRSPSPGFHNHEENSQSPSDIPGDLSLRPIIGRKRKASTSRGRGSVQERSKTTRACDSCKSKKTKCSGTLPCERCTKLSLLCDYKSSYMRGIPPSPVQVHPAVGPREPESNIQHHRTDGDSNNDIIFEASRHTASVRSHLRPTVTRERIYTLSSRNSPERGATDFTGQYLGPSSGVTFLNRAWRRLNQDYVSKIPHDLQHESSHDTSTFNYGDSPFPEYQKGIYTLPSQQRASELVSMYFDYAVVTYRFLHKGTTQQWLKDIYESGQSLSDEPSQSLVSKAAILFMIFALVTLHEEQYQERHNHASGDTKSVQWYVAAKHMMSLEIGPPCLEMIQARLIQCLYLLASSRANQGWYTFGTTTHMLMALGFHRKRSRHLAKAPGTYIKIECQKRVFWSSYTTDRYLSVMLGRPRTFHDEDIDQDLPDEINDEDMTPDGPKPTVATGDCVLTASLYHYRLGRLVGEISREVYTVRPISETARLEAAERLASDLKSWENSLPPIFSSVHPSSLVAPLRRQSNVLRIAHAHAVIHASRSFLLSNFSDLNRRPAIPEEKVLFHVSKCVDAAKLIVEIVNSMSDSAPLSQAFWFTHYACFCAVVVLYIYTIQQQRFRHAIAPGGLAAVRAQGRDDGLLELAERCQRQLAEATKRNSPSRKYSIILEELRQEVHRQLDPSLEHMEHFVAPDNPPVPNQLAEVLPVQSVAEFSQVDFMDPSSSSYTATVQDAGVDAEINVLVQQQMELPDNWDLIGWPQLDSWVYANVAESSAEIFPQLP